MGKAPSRETYGKGQVSAKGPVPFFIFFLFICRGSLSHPWRQYSLQGPQGQGFFPSRDTIYGVLPEAGGYKTGKDNAMIERREILGITGPPTGSTPVIVRAKKHLHNYESVEAFLRDYTSLTGYVEPWVSLLDSDVEYNWLPESGYDVCLRGNMLEVIRQLERLDPGFLDTALLDGRGTVRVLCYDDGVYFGEEGKRILINAPLERHVDAETGDVWWRARSVAGNEDAMYSDGYFDIAREEDAETGAFHWIDAYSHNGFYNVG